ncbi:MAG TPA: hypothetical protein VKZ49_02795 [Polyangiaceae bacterium]|nr:hypothetical protein [Polyangiaceae bacterium]
MSSFLEPIFRALNDAGIRYLVVGGLAAVLHGHARLTSDVDMIIDLEADEVRRALEVLETLGFQPRAPVDARDFADAKNRAAWIAEKGMRVFSMWDPKNPLVEIDLFVDHPILFDELWNESELMPLSDTTARVVSANHLIQLKRMAGRPQDLQDVEALEAIQRERNAKPKAE